MRAREPVSRSLKRLLRLPAARAADLLLRLSSTRAGLAVVYHRVGDPQGDPRRQLVPPHGTALFEDQLRHMATCYRPVTAAALPAAVRSRRRGERFPVAVTFDDDLACHVDVSMPVLRRLGMPATFFLSGASLERPYRFWFELLEPAVGAGVALPAGLPAVSRPPVPGQEPYGGEIHRLALAIEELSPAERDAVASGLSDGLGPHPANAGLRADQVRRLVDAGFAIGFHTRRHDRLTELDEEALATAMVDGRQPLEALSGGPLQAVAYPHGKADARVAAAARRAGYRTGYTTAREAVPGAGDPLLCGRLEPSFESVGHFAVELVKLLGARMIRGRT